MIGFPGLAQGNAESSDPPMTAEVVATDPSSFRDASSADPADNTVEIAAGGSVTFHYPTGTSQHNVTFATAPSSCTQTAGLLITPGPPLPSFAQPPGWSGHCEFNTPGTYDFVCGIHSDMKGKVMAINAAGGAVDIAMRKMLRTKGLEVNRDFVQIEAPLPSMRAILADKKADMVPLVVPFSFDPELRKIAKPLFLNSDVMGVTQLLFWTARKSFIDKNRAAMVDFMEDTLRITSWFLDPKNHAEVIAIASRVTKQPPERLGWVFTNKDYHHAPGMRPDLVALQRNVALVKELGLTDADIDVNKYSDLSLLDDAAKRLK